RVGSQLLQPLLGPLTEGQALGLRSYLRCAPLGPNEARRDEGTPSPLTFRDLERRSRVAHGVEDADAVCAAVGVDPHSVASAKAGDPTGELGGDHPDTPSRTDTAAVLCQACVRNSRIPGPSCTPVHINRPRKNPGIKPKNCGSWRDSGVCQRRMRDSNPRGLAPNTLSKRAP